MQEPYYRLPADLSKDIDDYAEDVARFESAALSAAMLKARRVPRGVYEQREDGSFMVRVRIAGGAINSRQAKMLAQLSEGCGSGRLHVTTRQDIQIHDVQINDTPGIMRELLTVGLTSKGGGGNTVRNVMACPYAGICPCEKFDVTPFAHAVTEFLIPLIGSYNLPRKYKIAFSGCDMDCALARVNDLGFIATVKDGNPGFVLHAGGGMGVHSRAADMMEEWVSTEDVVRIAEGMRRIFDKHGNRADRQRARLRFVFEKIGADAVLDRLHEEMRVLENEGLAECNVRASVNDAAEEPRQSGPGPGLSESDGVRFLPQRQAGFVAIPLHLPMGFVESTDLVRIADVATRFSEEKGFRTTRSQNLLLRFIKDEDIPLIADALAAIRPDLVRASPLERFSVCAGSSTCRLGLCLSRNAAAACADGLAKSPVEITDLPGMNINMSGCPNACGQHPVAAVGLFGIAQRHEGRLVPCYRVVLGARNDRAAARLAEPVGQVPARELPAFLATLAGDFQANRSAGEAFADYFERMGISHFSGITESFESIPSYDENPSFYRDWNRDEDFSLAGRGAGECGAGVFEVISNDLAEAKRVTKPFAVLLPTARALLITRGVDSSEPSAIFREFEKHFVETGLVDSSFSGLLSRARGYLEGWDDALKDSTEEIARLRERVELLFSTLDASLEFHPPDVDPKEGTTCESKSDSVELDLRGVACPMNFVKAKLRLEQMAIGDALTIILDEGEPIANVPASFRGEGQEIVEMVDIGAGHWRLVVRKKV